MKKLLIAQFIGIMSLTATAQIEPFVIDTIE
ncbi:MAG: hypothetical protein ACI97X_001200, partial [Oceanospirillaceae bacterium]